MATQPDPPNAAHTYLAAKFDQLAAALREEDGPAARAVIDGIRADGHPQVAEHVEAGLIAAGLARTNDDR